MARVAQAILLSALAREESRGAHFRSDFPRRDDQRFQKHSVFGKNSPVRFESGKGIGWYVSLLDRLLRRHAIIANTP